MKSLKSKWEIQNNWQLFWPFFGLLLLVLTCLKLSFRFFDGLPTYAIIAIALVTFILSLKFTVWILEKLASKWNVTYRFEMIAIFIVFAFTGSSAAYISRPFMSFIGLTPDNFPAWLYWILFTLGGFVFYQIFLVIYAFIFGQFQFFWTFQKKMLKRFGLKI
ncbi:MAG: hypothetical protein NWS37_06105 [Flavobacteriaceae bacterium]|nr:hypothetical protein [Flavobacteriaceae bacterium]